MSSLAGVLAGKKTYISAALTVLGAIAAYLTGDATGMQAFQLVSTAVMAATVRHGVASN
jgi:hypothetical protein